MGYTMRDVYGVMLKDYPDVMNIGEMSRALGVSTKTGYKLLHTGKITAMKVGRTYRIPKVHLLTYLRVLAEVNRRAAASAERVYEVVCGIPVCHKGGQMAYAGV